MTYKILSKTKAKELKSLSTKKGRESSGLFLAEGDKCVRDILVGFIPKYIIATEEWLLNNSDLGKKYEDKILSADKRSLEILSNLNSIPDVMAFCYQRNLQGEEISLDANKFYVLLDEIQDPGNLGTIIRTCDWFGIYDIFASRNTVDVYSPKVVQSTMGSLSRVNVHYLNLSDFIKNHREIKLIGTLLKGQPLGKISQLSGGFLLMGNEGRGISESLKELIDVPVTIPPVNPKEHPDSLNVAVATAIVLSHFKTDDRG